MFLFFLEPAQVRSTTAVNGRCSNCTTASESYFKVFYLCADIGQHALLILMVHLEDIMVDGHLVINFLELLSKPLECGNKQLLGLSPSLEVHL